MGIVANSSLHINQETLVQFQAQTNSSFELCFFKYSLMSSEVLLGQ